MNTSFLQKGPLSPLGTVFLLFILLAFGSIEYTRPAKNPLQVNLVWVLNTVYLKGIIQITERYENDHTK